MGTEIGVGMGAETGSEMATETMTGMATETEAGMATETEVGIDAVPGRSARRRQAILEAATEVFVRQGYLGATTDQVAPR